MKPLKVALVVPDYTYRRRPTFHLSDLKRACHAGEVDLVVFPESFECVPVAAAQDAVGGWASTLKVPVLMGLESDGFQLAVYHNPHAKGDDTSDHVYVKHSTAERLAYEWPDYQGASDAMFLPVRLKGESLGIQICHDMFYGLVGHRLRQNGARVLIDLSYENVILAKWRNIIRARSLELGGPFLCTMAYDPQRKSGRAAGLVYRNGRPLSPLADTTGPNGWGGYVVFDLGQVGGDEEDGVQPFSEKVYKDINLSLGTGKIADVVCRLHGEQVKITGKAAGQGHDQWLRFANKAGSIGLLPLPLSALSDGLAVHRLDVPESTFDHHLLLYDSTAPPVCLGDALSLMKLRAIEHRVGVALLGGNVREVMKTNNYKNIQRFVELDGVFAFNAECLGGTWTTAGASSLQGVPRRWFACYRSLLA
jgi:predicted amidohydrolase